jgi:hypothetical protein
VFRVKEKIMTREEKRSEEAKAKGLVTEACVMTGPVDWQMLRMQKQDLVNVISKLFKYALTTETQDESLTGILHLIDHIQDDAATTIGEDVVFCDYPGQNEVD